MFTSAKLYSQSLLKPAGLGLILFAALPTVLPFSAQAESLYIDDTLRVPVRSGASTDHRIVTFLISGARVETIESSEMVDDWKNVSLKGGKIGWIQQRYLRNTPAAKQLLSVSQKSLSKSKQLVSEQKATIKTLQAEIKTLNGELTQLKGHSQSTDKELSHIKDLSKNAIRLDHSNSKLLEDNELLKVNNEDFNQQIVKLESSQKNQGMIYGAAAIFFGIILGWLMPKMKTKRNDGWS